MKASELFGEDWRYIQLNCEEFYGKIERYWSNSGKTFSDSPVSQARRLMEINWSERMRENANSNRTTS